MRTYSIFNVWSGNIVQVLLKLATGILILDIVPLFQVLAILKYVPENAHNILLASGVASLSVFAMVFLLMGVLQTGWGNLIYPGTEWADEANDAGIPPNNPSRSLIAAVAYAIVPILIAAKWL